jgi:NAD+ synthase
MNATEYRNMVIENTKDFDAIRAIDYIKEWLNDFIKKSGMKKAVLGISGGKDSTIVAKLLVDVMGRENVIGLLMPNGIQKDINDSKKVVEILDIENHIINIEHIYNNIVKELGYITDEAKINIAPRIRMTTLYTFGQTHGALVAGTGNLSERMLGYFTKHGDGACDFNLIGNYTSFEVMRIGEELGLPIELVYKTPDDGLSGMSDEEKLGITYKDVHNYLRKDINDIDNNVKEKIERMIKGTSHKRVITPIP